MTPAISHEEAMATPLKRWWTAFFDLVSFADDAATGEIAIAEGGKLSAFTSAKLARQRQRREALRRDVRKALDGWIGDTPVGALKVGGVKAHNANGGTVPVYTSPQKPRILLSNGQVGGVIEVVPPHSDVVANFLVWFWNVGPAMGNNDPRQVVRQSLAAVGITQENYRTHPKSPGYGHKDLIEYPWDA